MHTWEPHMHFVLSFSRTWIQEISNESCHSELRQCFTMKHTSVKPSITYTAYTGLGTNWLLTPDMPNSTWLLHIKCIDYIGYRREKQVKTFLLIIHNSSNLQTLEEFGSHHQSWLYSSFSHAYLQNKWKEHNLLTFAIFSKTRIARKYSESWQKMAKPLFGL